MAQALHPPLLPPTEIPVHLVIGIVTAIVVQNIRNKAKGKGRMHPVAFTLAESHQPYYGILNQQHFSHTTIFYKRRTKFSVALHNTQDGTEVGHSTQKHEDMPDGMEVPALVMCKEIRSTCVEQTFSKQEYK